MNDLLSIVQYTLNDDNKPGDYLVTPAVAYFCFESYDFDFEKPVLDEDIFSDVKKEQKALRKKKTSELTGTVYKLSKEQKAALKYLKKKYGRSLTKEIKEYRKKTLAPYQVAKTYMERSKALYPKEVLGMTKEEYFKYKKSAEDKIANMRSNRYEELTKEYSDYSRKKNDLDKIQNYFSVHDISEPALNKIFKKYGFYSSRYTEAEMREYQKKLRNIDKIKKELIRKIASNEEISDEDRKRLNDAVEASRSTKTELSKKETSAQRELNRLKLIRKIASNDKISDSEKDKIRDDIEKYNPNDSDEVQKNAKELKDISDKISGLSIPDDLKSSLKDTIDSIDENGAYKTKSFEQEYENFLMREKIKDDIRKQKDNKYVDDYNHALEDIKGSLENKKSDTVSKMAKERESKTFNDKEKKIYELKPGAKKDSDRLSDYTLKIKEEDFFEPRFYNKSEEFKEAERKIDAEIKRFERSLESKMEEKDFQLLKKYRLISNLVTIKNAKPADFYKKKSDKEEKTDEENK